MSFKIRSKTRTNFRSPSSFKLKTLSAALLSVAVLSSVHAAGLGRLTVQSSLGQPLRAEIELTSVAPDELGSLAPRLAPAEAYRQANIELNPTLLSLRFAVEQRPGGPVVRVTSTQPVNEPFVDMLLELGGTPGRLVREYTFLLDPPEMRSARPAAVAPVVNSQVSLPPPPAAASSPAPVSAPAPADNAPAAEPRSAPAPAAVPTRAPAPQPVSAKSRDEHAVRKGDTLAKIANRYREPGVSLDQMLVALYRANPDAFVDRNMNRLRTGQILSIPLATEAETIETSEARGVVVAQAADFNAYRDKLAARTAASEARPSEAGRQAASGSITARVQEESAAGATQDRLQLSNSGATGQTAGAAGRTAGVGEEELIARDKALAEANARVRELEKNVNDLQKLLEIKNQDLAARQGQAAVTPADAAPAVPAADAQPDAPVAESSSEVATPAAGTPPVADAAGVQSPAAQNAATDNPPPAKKKPKPPAPVPQPPGFFEDLSNNPMFLPGAAALLALLAALGIYSSRRRKQPAKSFEDSIITDSSLKSNSLFGSTGGQSVDTNNSVFNSNFVPSASQLDTNEVDPIAEADVYIAYGRDAQAEEILKEALRNQPDRHAVRVKLLEIYSSRNDVRSFEILATELYSMTRGEGEEWKQAAALGLALDPSNPLYASGAVSDEFAEKAALLTAPTQPLEADTSVADDETDSRAEAPLDFDLTDLPETTPKVEPPVAERAEDKAPEVADLEFDLDGFGGQTQPAPEQRAPVTDPGLPPEVTAINFDFLEAPQSAGSATDDTAASPEPTSEPPAPARVEPSASAPEVLLPESFDLEFPSAGEQAAPAATPSPQDFDLSDISLELDPQDGAKASDELPVLDGLDEGDDLGSAEMSTKLDLALAYQEIGDKEGARELLEEVLKGGNSEQSARASELLGKLD